MSKDCLQFKYDLQKDKWLKERGEEVQLREDLPKWKRCAKTA